MRGQFHVVVKHDGIELGSQAHWDKNSSHKGWLGPTIGDCQVKNDGIQNPKSVGVYAGCLDKPLGALVKQGVVVDGKIDRVLDKESSAGGIKRPCTVFLLHGEGHEHEKHLKQRDDNVCRHFSFSDVFVNEKRCSFV